MIKKINKFGGDFNHKQLVDYLMKHPELIDKEFNPINSEVHFLRGQIDIIGRIKTSYLWVEVKIDPGGGLITKARSQLKQYDHYIRKYLEIFKESLKEEIKLRYCIVRLTKKNLHIYLFENRDELLNQRYSNGVGYYEGTIEEAKEKHRIKAVPKKYLNKEGVRD